MAGFTHMEPPPGPDHEAPEPLNTTNTLSYHVDETTTIPMGQEDKTVALKDLSRRIPKADQDQIMVEKDQETTSEWQLYSDRRDTYSLFSFFNFLWTVLLTGIFNLLRTL